MRACCAMTVALAAAITPTPVAAQERTLVLDREVTATLGPEAPHRAGRPYHLWTFRTDAAITARIDMTSDALDAYLVLQDSTGRFLQHDDNSGGGRNARIVRDLAAGAQYRLVARSFTDTAAAYTIRVGRLAETNEGVVGTIRRGDEVTGALATGDPQVSGGRPYRAYLFEGRAGDTVTIELRSDAFDAFLIVQDASGRELGENDDFGGELHSRLEFAVPATARYRIVATAFSAEGRGAYTLRVR